MKLKPVYFEDVQQGDAIPSLTKNIKLVNLVMYQGATWDFHRYHYDLEFAQQKGFPKPFLDGQMLGAYLASMLMDWIGVEGTIKKLGFRFTNFVYPGDVLTCKGQVVGKSQQGDQGAVECALWIENQKGERVLDKGSALVFLPLRGQQH